MQVFMIDENIFIAGLNIQLESECGSVVINTLLQDIHINNDHVYKT
jgi:hypothetical protein